jgi:uncharacterized repeat protein (TIGR01451 family)
MSPHLCNAVIVPFPTDGAPPARLGAHTPHRRLLAPWIAGLASLASLAATVNAQGPPGGGDFGIAVTHVCNFVQGQSAAKYSITVSNAANSVVSSGPVTVTDQTPAGLTLASVSGTGWSCDANVCTRSDTINPGASYPTLTATFAVSPTAGPTAVNSVTVAGGGSPAATATDSTTIVTSGALSTGTSVTPACGTGASQTFAFQFADPSGATDLSSLWVWFSPTPTLSLYYAANSCLLEYDLVGRQLYLYGSGSMLSNDQCSVGSPVTVTASGNTVTMSLPMTFSPYYSGILNIFALESGNNFNSGWLTLGSWTAPAAPFAGVDSGVPVLSIASTHSGAFEQNQNGATYTVTVSNLAGAGPTTAAVTVTDSLPTALTLVSMTGAGWTCTTTATPYTCTRSDALMPGATYPPITVTVNVASNTATTLSNSVSVSGGGAANASASDVTTVLPYAPSTVGANGVAVTPVSGSGVSQTFILQYIDPNGASDLSTLWLWFNPAFSLATGAGAHSCFISYDRLAGQLYLADDHGNFSASMALAGAGNVSNSQCSITLQGTPANPAGNTLTLTLPITFTSAYAGLQNIYMLAGGAKFNSGWQTAGNWTVVAPTSGSPVLAISSMQSGSFTQGETGAAYVVTVSNLATGIATTGTVTVTETPPPAGLTVTSMAGAGWTCLSNTCTRGDSLNPGVSYPPITVSVGVAATAISPLTNSVSVSDGTVTASVAESTTVLSASGTSSAAAGAVSAQPINGTGASQTFVLQYTDPNGAGDLSAAWVWFNATLSLGNAKQSCLLYYDRVAGQLFLYDDMGMMLAPVAPGASALLGNSQCSVNPAAATASLSGTTLTLTLPMTLTASFAGTQNIYMLAAGTQFNSGWQTAGVWIAP